MSLIGKIGKGLARGASAVATGGASEAYRAATGKADPYTAYQENLAKGISNKVDSMTGQTAPGVNPYANMTPEEKARAQQQASDLGGARSYADQLRVNAARDGSRSAPMVQRQNGIAPATVGGVGQISAQQVNSTFDPAAQAAAQNRQQAYLDQAQAAANGGVPSAAAMQMKAGSQSAIRQAYAMSAGNKGYGGGALRNAQRVGAQLSQQNVAATGQLRANEMATARQEYGNAVGAARGQDIGLEQTRAAMGLQAATANQGANMDAARANQAAELQQKITQAGFDQQAVMHMSDQELAVKMANAGMQISQQQIDDLRAHNNTQSALEAQGQVLSGGNAQAMADLQRKQLQANYQQALDAQKRKDEDAALAGTTQLVQNYYTGGLGGLAKGAGGGGLSSQGTIDPFA